MCRIFSAHTRENTALRCSNDRSVKFHDTSHATKHGFKGEIEKAHENIMTLTLESLTMPAATDGPTHNKREKSDFAMPDKTKKITSAFADNMFN